MTFGPTKAMSGARYRFRASWSRTAQHVVGKAPRRSPFVGERGAVMRSQTFQRAALTAAATELGIPGFHPHELRHTAASLAIASGADVKVVHRCSGTSRRR